MKVEFEKKIWFQAKSKLLRLYQSLSEADFQFSEGGERRMMERIRTKIQLSRADFYAMIGLLPNSNQNTNASYNHHLQEV